MKWKTYLDFLFFPLSYSADVKKFRSHSQVYCCSVSAVVAAAPSLLFLASVKRLPLCVYRTKWGGGKGFLFPLSKRKPPPVLMPLERFFFQVFEQSGLFGEYIRHLRHYNIYGLNSFRVKRKRRLYYRFVKTTIAAYIKVH